MKKQLMTGLFTVLALTAGAQTFQEWRNPEINAVNRAPMHTNYFAFENADAAKKANKKQSTNYMTLNVTWKTRISSATVVWDVTAIYMPATKNAFKISV